MTPSPAFDSLNAELSLAIIQFLPVRSSSYLSQSSKRFYYLVHQFRTLLGPEVVCSESRNGLEDAVVVYNDALLRMRSLPQLVIYFSGSSPFGSHAADLPFYRSQFPAPQGAVVIGCTSSEPARVIHCGSNHTGPACDIEDYVSVMVVGGPPLEEQTTHVQPFRFHAPRPSVAMTNEQFLQQFSARSDWKTFIIFAKPSFPSIILEHLQEQYPEALIVGGCCDDVFAYHTPVDNQKGLRVSRYYKGLKGKAAPPGMTVDEMWERIGPILQTQGATACGVALSGDIPFHAVVSQGSESVTEGKDLVVRQSTVRRLGDESCHVIQEIASRFPSPGISMSGSQFFDKFEPDLIGIKYPNLDGFSTCDAGQAFDNAIHLTGLDGTPVNGFGIDAFQLSKESMLADVQEKLNCLRDSLDDRRIMGAMMISCNGRGPGGDSMLGENEADASRFAATFPSVPCIGWYARGEIGPRARALEEHPSPFRTGESCIQGFTAVFGVFIAPLSNSTTKTALDDTPLTVAEFVKNQLQT